jgi:hypothetical protein
MSIKITHVRLSAGGTQHEHITDLKWVGDQDGKVDSSTKAVLVDWIENKKGTAHTGSGTSRAEVGVVTPAQGSKYLRTYADGKWNNNLLSLPRF